MKVGIIGLGYVGLPLAVAFAEAGHAVVGLDSDARKVERLRDGRSDVEDVPGERLAALGDSFAPTTDRGALAECDAVLICVPTPLANHREPDLTYLVDAATSLSGVLREGQLVVLESTTYPGHHPRPAQADPRGVGARRGPRLPPRLLARAHRPRAHRLHDPDHAQDRRRPHRRLPRPAAELYGEICDEVVPVSGPEAAELTKLLENIFRSVNIALVNELARLCDRMEIDIWEVVDAAGTKPFGFMPFDPGPGWAGTACPSTPSTSRSRPASTTSTPSSSSSPGRSTRPSRTSASQDRAHPQRRRQARQGLADPAPRRRLQGRRRGPARVAGAQDHPPAARPGRRGRLPRPPRPRGAEHGLASADLAEELPRPTSPA